jgi:hypothetical protein
MGGEFSRVGGCKLNSSGLEGMLVVSSEDSDKPLGSMEGVSYVAK